FAHGRLIDLSYAAATKLGFAHKGTARVEVEAIDMDNWPPSRALVQKPATTAPAPRGDSIRSSQGGASLWVQAGAFSSAATAENLRRQLQQKLARPVEIQPTSGASPLYRVRIGPLASRAEAEQVRSQLLAQGGDAHIVE